MSESTNAPARNEEELKRLEVERVAEIEALKAKYSTRVSNINEIATEAIQLRVPVELFRGTIFSRINDSLPVSTDSLIGMSEREKKQFSYLRLINALANPSDARLREEAKFEFEVSDAALMKEGRGRRGGAQATIPYDMVSGRRDLIVTTGSIGGNLVQTTVDGANFIEALRARMVFQQLGAKYLTGLQGKVALPRNSAATTVYWVAENSAPTEGAPTYDQVTLSPSTVGGWVDYSRRLMIQSSVDIENMLRTDLAQGLAVGIEAACISGTSTANQPTGILNVSGIGSTTGGTAGASPTWANIVELEQLVATANADIGALGYLTNPKGRGKLKQTTKSTSAVTGFVWDTGDSPVNGYKAAVTSNVPSNLVKGTASTCSAIVFGNYQDMIIGMWGNGVDILVDPYTGSSAGTVRVVALADVDMQVRQAGSFAAMKDALTV